MCAISPPSRIVDRFAAIFTLVLAAKDGSLGQEQKPGDMLRSKYPWGSIYISYIPLNDMTNTLNDKGNFNQLAKLPPGEAVLARFKGFLNQIKEQRLSEAVAFLQLNLVTGKAGFKMLSARNGEIQEIAWGTGDVEGIAQFCDRALNRLLEFDKLHDSMRANSNDITIKGAWDSATSLIGDPHIPPQKIAPMMDSFRKLIEARPAEWRRLKGDKLKFDRIEKFRGEYDSELRQLKEKSTDQSVHESLDRREKLPGDLKKSGEFEREWNQRVIDIVPHTGKPDRSKVGEPSPLRQLIDPSERSDPSKSVPREK